MLKSAVSVLAIAALIGCSSGDSTSSVPTGSDGTPTSEAVTPPSTPKSFEEFITETERYGTFAELMSLSEYADRLGPDSETTIFLVPNAGFDRLPAGTVEALKDPANIDVLNRFIGYHLLEGAVPYDGMLEGPLTTLSGDEVTITYGDAQFPYTKILVNGIQLVVGSLPAGKCLIHLMADVLVPPGMDLGSL